MGRWSKNQELDTLSQAMYHARELAMTRMEAEADVLGADGIVGVRLDIEFKEFGSDLAEFIAVGTAVKADEAHARTPDGFSWRNNRNQPFTSDLSGQDFWTLLQAGYAPLGMVMGSCVYHIAHQRFWQAIGNTGQNVEIPQFTEALYDARELAMSRMQAEAEALTAEGIVGVQLLSLPHRWGGHTTEFFAIGTAVRPLREDHTIATPSLVLPLTEREPAVSLEPPGPDPVDLVASALTASADLSDVGMFVRVFTNEASPMRCPRAWSTSTTTGRWPTGWPAARAPRSRCR